MEEQRNLEKSWFLEKMMSILGRKSIIFPTTESSHHRKKVEFCEFLGSDFWFMTPGTVRRKFKKGSKIKSHFFDILFHDLDQSRAFETENTEIWITFLDEFRFSILLQILKDLVEDILLHTTFVEKSWKFVKLWLAKKTLPSSTYPTYTHSVHWDETRFCEPIVTILLSNSFYNNHWELSALLEQHTASTSTVASLWTCQKWPFCVYIVIIRGGYCQHHILIWSYQSSIHQHSTLICDVTTGRLCESDHYFSFESK